MTRGQRPATFTATRRSGGSLGFLSLGADVFAGDLVDLLHAELDLAAIVEAQHLDLHLIADLDDVRDFADSLGRQLADVNEAVARPQEVDEGTEIDRLHHLAGIDDADLGL